MDILYCDRCDLRISRQDAEEGAFRRRDNGEVVCSRCRVSTHKSARPAASSTRDRKAAPKRKSSKILPVGSGVAALAIGLIVLLVANTDDPKRPAATPNTAAKTTTRSATARPPSAGKAKTTAALAPAALAPAALAPAALAPKKIKGPAAPPSRRDVQKRPPAPPLPPAANMETQAGRPDG